MYRFYKQRSAEKDVVYLLVADLMPDEVANYDDVTLLYNNKRLIGANFFGKETSLFSSYGMQPVVPENVLASFNAILEKHEIAPLASSSSSGFKIGEVKEVEEHPLDERKSLLKIDAEEGVYETVSDKKAKIGEKVAIALNDTFLFDGTLFVSHIDHNLKIDVLLVEDSEIGISKEDFENLLTRKAPGEDLFA